MLNNARRVTEVAVGVVIDESSGRYLLGSRPEGKPYAGYWEFPGGKLEAGESVHEALVRELNEELNIRIGESFPWFVMEHDYPHAYVRLHFRRTFSFSGSMQALESQQFAWFDRNSSLSDYKLLPMDQLVICRLYLPSQIRLTEADQFGTCSVVRTVEEMSQAAQRGDVFAITDNRDLLQSEPYLPLYVRGSADELLELMRRGAHGVVIGQ